MSEPAPTAGARAAPSDRMPWVSMGAVLFGTVMVALDQTIVTIALPRIGAELNSLEGVDLVFSAYLLALGVVQPTTGWLADRFGRKRVFLGSLAVFSAGALVSGLAADLPQLVVARIIQGAGGGAIFPVGMAMIYEQVPPGRRGLAMGVWSLGIAVAPAIGPLLGGIVLTTLGWRWLFFLTVPIGLVGIAVGARVLRFHGYREARPFDVLGFGLVTVGLGLLLYAVSGANRVGWTSPITLATGLGGLILMALWVVHELRVPDPLIDLRMFAIPAWNVAMILVAAMVSVTLARLVFLPLELVTLRAMSEVDVGLILTPAALTGAVAAPLAGALSDRVGARIPVALGLGAMALAAFGLAQLNTHTSTALIAAAVALQGMGQGLALTPIQVVGMDSLPQRLLARGTAIRSTTRQVAGSFSIALLTAYVAVRAGGLGQPGTESGAAELQQAFNGVFAICALVAVASLLVALRAIPHGAEMKRNAAARATEHERLVTGAARR